MVTLDNYNGRVVVDHALFGLAKTTAVRFELDDGSVVESHTDGFGTVLAPPGVDHAFVLFKVNGTPMRMFCAFEPPPASSAAGIWQRLRNLGYEPPGLTNADYPLPADQRSLQMAIEEFQADHGIAISGETDKATVDAIEAAHDSDTRAWRDRNWLLAPDPSPLDLSQKGDLT